MKVVEISDGHESVRICLPQQDTMRSRYSIWDTHRFCTAGADSKLRLFSSHLKSEDTVTVMDGHTSYVNDVVFEPTEGQQIASVSDDHTCRVWGLDGLQRACFPLYSPGMSVCWHPDEPAKVPMSSLLPVTAGGLSWHATLPVCAVGGDRKVHLWMTEI
ncbi:nucleoporin Nup37-like [Ptychodera flava]|uniref:nucleoporin Nup37-like n=1 Tax=Ptychodera flava TaxID=63121 RepID=UPI00396A7B0D